jgi:hypothetical protein
MYTNRNHTNDYYQKSMPNDQESTWDKGHIKPEQKCDLEQNPGWDLCHTITSVRIIFSQFIFQNHMKREQIMIKFGTEYN